MPPEPFRKPVHVVIVTHTPRHLDTCLAGLALQDVHPASVVVSSDADDPAILDLLHRTWPRVASALSRGSGQAAPILAYTARPHQGVARSNQVRNSGLRALDGLGLLRDADQLLLLDGDTVLERGAIEAHARLASLGFELVIPYRINLDARRAAEITVDRLLDPDDAALEGIASEEEFAALSARHARYRRQLTKRRLFGSLLIKAHKPKILGGHHAVSVRAMRRINGYDEMFEGYGYDDDDLGLRLYALRPRIRCAIAVSSIRVYHLWHPSRAPARPTDSPMYERFTRRGIEPEAERGWRNPRSQAAPEVTVIPPDARSYVATRLARRE